MCYGGSEICESGRWTEYNNGERLPNLVAAALQRGYYIATKSCVLWTPKSPSKASVYETYVLRVILLMLESSVCHHFNLLSADAVDNGALSPHMNQDTLDYTGLCIHSPLGEISALGKFMQLSPEEISAYHLHMENAARTRRSRYRSSKRSNQVRRD
jgi:hypothetical protein